MKAMKFIFVLLFLLTSCGEEELSAKKNREQVNVNPQVTSSNTLCSQSTLVKPPVDFLFLFDNSASTFFLDNGTKTALNNLISTISDRFDYHVVMAPLVADSFSNSNKNAGAYFFSSEPFVSSDISILSKSSAVSQLNFLFPTVDGSGGEAGVRRVVDIINYNLNTRGNDVFRKDAYTMIVVMSSEDDTEHGVISQINAYTETKKRQLMCLRGRYNENGVNCNSVAGIGSDSLDSLMMRFFSVVAHTDNCSVPGVSHSTIDIDRGRTYLNMAGKVLTTPYYDLNTQTYTSNSSSDGDTRNICSGNFSTLFDGINNAIQDAVIHHVYDHWPIITSSSPINPVPFDVNTVRVRKNTGQEFLQGTTGNTFEVLKDGSNNAQFFANRDTRIFPTAGEPHSGYFVKLNGAAQVTFPECLIVTTTTPAEYFGFFALDAKPFEASIVVKINGVTINKSITNGWQLVKQSGQPKFFPSKNIKIQGPGNFAEGFPAVNRSGYMIQFYGSSVYTNGDVVQVIYDPST